MLVEAADEVALARGMQAFEISVAKRINGLLRSRDGRPRRGSVFPDHYHPRALTTPREVRNVLSYVFNNWRRHREDQHGIAREWLVDPFSSAIGFDGWAELGWGKRFVPRTTYLALVAKPATTWLLTTGWKRHGPISYFEVPGPQPR